LEEVGAYVFSLLFAFLGSLIFALIRTKEERVPQEAIIGIVYAVAAAATILMVDRAPHGAEHIKYLLVGNVLWVSWSTIGHLFVVIAIVACFHFLCHRTFSLVSFDPAEAKKRGISIPVWDLFFYLSLAWVVTTSVQTAGVLLVFSFLIVPAVCGLLLAKNVQTSLFVGWLVGAGVTLAGAYFSYRWDFPTGAAIICTFGATLFLISLMKKFVGA
jgi:zinc/manganese transport system permease protein